MTQDDRMETITAETDNPTVCITHGRFIPCRNEDWHHFTDNPYWVKSVRDFQGSDDPNLTWEPATLTITDPAAIRASDEPDERGDFPCCTTPAPASGAGLDLDAIEAAALADDGWWSVPAFALVAEVRRLAALCIPLTDLAQELDMARQNLHHSRAMSSAHFERAERENARAEAAEAEVGTLRARLARSRSRYCGCGWCCSNNADGVVPGDAHLICSRYRAALAVTTGEGQ